MPKATPKLPHGRGSFGPRAVRDPPTRGNTLHGNREVPRSSGPRWEASGAERIVKAEGVRR